MIIILNLLLEEEEFEQRRSARLAPRREVSAIGSKVHDALREPPRDFYRISSGSKRINTMRGKTTRKLSKEIRSDYGKDI